MRTSVEVIRGNWGCQQNLCVRSGTEKPSSLVGTSQALLAAPLDVFHVPSRDVSAGNIGVRTGEVLSKFKGEKEEHWFDSTEMVTRLGPE